MAEALLDRETLSGDEVKRLMKGETLPPLDLKANPRKLTTTKDLEKSNDGGKSGPDGSAGRSSGQTVRLDKTDSDKSGEDEYAPGYDLYGKPPVHEPDAVNQWDKEREAAEERDRKAGHDAGSGAGDNSRSEKEGPGAKPAARSPLGAALDAGTLDDSEASEKKTAKEDDKH